MSIAYALRDEYAQTYVGGVLALGNSSLDIRQALEDGNGAILVEDTDTERATILDAYPPLRRIDPPTGNTSLPVGHVPDGATDEPVEIPMADLRARARALGIDSPGRSRDEITAAIASAEAAVPVSGPDATPEG